MKYKILGKTGIEFLSFAWERCHLEVMQMKKSLLNVQSVP